MNRQIEAFASDLFFLCKSATNRAQLTDSQQMVVPVIPKKPEIRRREVRPEAGGVGFILISSTHFDMQQLVKFLKLLMVQLWLDRAMDIKNP